MYQGIGKKNGYIGNENIDNVASYVHTTDFLPLGKNWNIYIGYLIFYPSRQHVK